MPTITDRINKIIDKRKINLEKISSVMQTTQKCCQCVQNFEQLQSQIKQSNNTTAYQNLFQGNPDIIHKILEITPSPFYEIYQKYLAKAKQLTDRFHRDELHISFIGRAGQGKSLVMQNISGLDGHIIPSSDGSDCTGAKSIIINRDVSHTHAEIQFYSQREMIDIVNQYLKSICHSYYEVGSIEDIKHLPIKEIESKSKDHSSTVQALLRHLKKYIEHISDFEYNLGRTITVEESEIESYVAQYKKDQHEIKYFHYLGVKTANIICKFPHLDTGKIVLVDTIGIGATSLGIEAHMLDTVENDSDAVVLMCRPDPFGRNDRMDEIEIISKVSGRISSEYTKEMLFWVLNRVETPSGNNTKQIPEFKEFIQSSGYAIADVLDVNCNSKEDVENNLLVPILTRLAERIEYVDHLLLQTLNTLGEELYAKYEKLCIAIDKVFAHSANEDIKRELASEINATIQTNLLNNLRNLYLQKYNQLRRQPCEKLQIASKQKLKKIFKMIPSKEEMLSLLNQGEINQHNAIEKCTDLIRIKIIDNFTELDDVLTEIVNTMKYEVLSILADKENGKLGTILEVGNNTPDEWITKLINKIDCQKKYPLIYKALDSFRMFSIHVQGFLIYEVRDKLDLIDFSLRKQPPLLNFTLEQKEELAEDITICLRNYIENVYAELEIVLSTLYSIPNRAMFAAIKDLYDRATYSKKDNSFSVTDEWRYLYEDWIHMVWLNQYNSHISMKNVTENWNQMISDLKTYHKKNLFLINTK